jgi:hypothetical protein
VLAAGIDPPIVQTGFARQDLYAANSFVITAQRAGIASFTIAASNPQNYIPTLPATTATALTVSTKQVANGIAWSEQGQPEAVPPLNTLPVGSGTIYGMYPTRDALWIFASDGLWRLSGTGGSAGRGFDWAVDLMDSTLSLAGPHAACVLRDTVYAYTNRGLVSISPKGIVEHSQGRLNDRLPGPPFNADTSIQIAADETNDEIWLTVTANSAAGYYIYNTLTDAWTTSAGNGFPNVITYARFLQSVVTQNASEADSPSAGNNYEAFVVDYQPISNGDPMTMKQWIDETWVLDPGSASTTFYIPRWNGSDSTIVRAPVGQNQDTRLSFSIPRNSPACANTLAPGVKYTPSSNPIGLFGVALRAVTMTNQRKAR